MGSELCFPISVEIPSSSVILRAMPQSVHRLGLFSYRNHAAFSLDSEGRPVVLCGPNGSGKTNILEALSLLSPGRGFRRAKLSDMLRWGEEKPWMVSAVLNETALSTGYLAGSAQRFIKQDDQDVSAQSKLTQILSLVWLTPQMDRLFSEGITAKRQFLDRLVYCVDSEHAGRVAKYEYLTKERLRILKEYSGVSGSWLPPLEQKIAASGVAIAAMRRQLVQDLNESLKARTDFVFPKVALGLDGEIELMLGQMPAVDVEIAYAKKLHDTRGGDAANGRTAVGPHRTDLQATDLGLGIPAAEASTGQQKALLISILLAHTAFQIAQHGTYPILLLDEVTTHLDAEKRHKLFQDIEALGVQYWVTGTDQDTFRDICAQALFHQF